MIRCSDSCRARSWGEAAGQREPSDAVPDHADSSGVTPWGFPAPHADVDEPAGQEVILASPVDQCRRLSGAEGPNSHLRTRPEQPG